MTLQQIINVTDEVLRFSQFGLLPLSFHFVVKETWIRVLASDL